MNVINEIFNSDLGLMIVVFGLIVIVVIFVILAKFFIPDSSVELKEKLRTQSRTVLNNANKMLQDGYFAQAVIESHKAVEIVMRGLLKNSTISSFDAIKKFQSKGLLSAQNVDRAHNLRIQRNKLAHGDNQVKPQLARVFVGDAHNVVSQLLK